MNIDTGILRELATTEEPGDNELLVRLQDATAEQRKQMRVGLDDSKLGLRRQRAIRRRRLGVVSDNATTNQKKKWRQKMRRK